MFCCRSCSEPVKKLLDESTVIRKILNFKVESAVICAQCVVSSHHGDAHEIFKFPVQKYQSLVNISNVEKRGKTLRRRFSSMLETFTLFRNRFRNYDNKIVEMEKLAIESRGEQNHNVLLDNYEKCLEEAEVAIQAIQINYFARGV
uniref:Uncharacterized protein n=1 Tax=Caenorhabditis japonica TaxID=281687 RepID=A0A8R1DJU0_CAEJA